MSHLDPAPGELELVRLFINSHDFEDDVEELSDPEALGRWLSEHGLAGDYNAATPADVSRAIEVREALRNLCLANNDGREDPEALATLDTVATGSPLVLRFGDHPELEPACHGVSGALARLLAIVSRSMADGTWTRLKTCPADDCLWAFYDRSRNRSGRWCTMAECGNRAKARTYRQRARG